MIEFYLTGRALRTAWLQVISTRLKVVRAQTSHKGDMIMGN